MYITASITIKYHGMLAQINITKHFALYGGLIQIKPRY